MIISANAARRTLLAAAILASLAGCASIISGRHADVTFESYPSDAHVTIHDDRGRPVASFATPGAANLKRNGRYFLPAHYTATITAPGFQTAQVPIGSTLNPWILGNVVIGGIPGLIVDNATGAAWKPKRSEIHAELMPLNGPEIPPVYSEAHESQQEAASGDVLTADRSAATASPSKRR